MMCHVFMCFVPSDMARNYFSDGNTGLSMLSGLPTDKKQTVIFLLLEITVILH